MTTTSWTRRLATAGVAVPLLLGSAAGGDERPRTSSTVKVKAQGGGSGTGTEALAGAPPAVEPSLASRKARATAKAPVTRAQADEPVSALRAVSLAEGEATLEIDGRREVVRPGSRLGEDVVRSVTEEQVVLERSPRPGQDEEGEALVIVTFDEAGRGRTRVFLARDPARDKEAKRP